VPVVPLPGTVTWPLFGPAEFGPANHPGATWRSAPPHQTLNPGQDAAALVPAMVHVRRRALTGVHGHLEQLR
jgi:hypothetical protein